MKLLSIFLGLCISWEQAESSVKLAALGAPKCNLPGQWRTKQKLNFPESKLKGAVVANNGFSWMTKLEDCANWCCLLPAANCSVAMLEIKTNGANCHLVVCYPTELCVFNYAPDFLSYDRTLFAASATDTPLKEAEQPIFSFQSTQHKNVIKPRKGVEDLPSEPPKLLSAVPGRAEKPATEASSSAAGIAVAAQKRGIFVGAIFLYAAIILAILALGAFLGRKFLDFWERRHYQRADFLLDGMYEHKSTSCS